MKRFAKVLMMMMMMMMIMMMMMMMIMMMMICNCARILLFLRGRDCSDGLISGAGLQRIGFGLYVVKHSLTANMCIVLMLIDIDSGVG